MTKRTNQSLQSVLINKSKFLKATHRTIIKRWVSRGLDILLTPCYYHWGARLNTMKRFCLCSLLLCSHPNVLTFFPGLYAQEVRSDLVIDIMGACHYLTNRFQMEAPVAPSRSLREASVGMAEAFAKPSRRLLEAFSARDVFMKRS